MNLHPGQFLPPPAGAKLFGLPAIAAAFYFTAKPERRAGLKVILLPAIVASVVCGVTEPLEFLFMFTYPDSFCSTPSYPPALL